MFDEIDDTSGELLFKVRDTGIGISEEHQTKLFKAFSQGDNSTNRKFGGSGLGLIISDLIIREMKSKINVKSTQGQGASFYFNLNTKIASENESISSKNLYSNQNCLIIVNNPTNIGILTNTLHCYGFHTSAIQNLEYSEKKADRIAQYDLIICEKNIDDLLVDITLEQLVEFENQKKSKLKFILLHTLIHNEEIYNKFSIYDNVIKLSKPLKISDFNRVLSNFNQTFENVTIPSNSLETKIESQILSDKKFKILIVDDLLINIIVLREHLKELCPNAEILEASNGELAIQMYEAFELDLIFMDIQMPEIDGIEATIKIRQIEFKREKKIPIIAQTAGVFKEEQEKCLLAGMNDFLSKPISTSHLSNILKVQLNIQNRQ